MTDSSPATQKLIEDHLPVVYRLARQIARRQPIRYDFDDLVGYGVVGLIEAANNFQSQRGIQFITFAYPRIRGAIFDGLSTLNWMSRAQFRRYLKQKRPSPDQNDDQLDSDTEESAGQAPVLGPPSSLSVEDLAGEVPSEDSSPSAIVTQDEILAMLGSLVDELPSRKRALITSIYIDGLTLQEASERLGISKGWASRLHASTLEELSVLVDRRTR